MKARVILKSTIFIKNVGFTSIETDSLDTSLNIPLVRVKLNNDLVYIPVDNIEFIIIDNGGKVPDFEFVDTAKNATRKGL